IHRPGPPAQRIHRGIAGRGLRSISGDAHRSVDDLTCRLAAVPPGLGHTAPRGPTTKRQETAMRLSRHFQQAAVAAALAVSLGMTPSVDAKTLKWAYQGDMMSLDPMSLNETFTLGFQSWFYETLTAYDKDLKLVPMLAERWENPEPTKWVFHL